MSSVKDNKLFCNVGDILEALELIKTTPWQNENSIEISAGTKYKAVSLVGYGWDLEIVNGNGPKEIRILNSEIQKHFKKT